MIQKVHQIIPWKALAKMLVLLSFAIQLAVIGYSHGTGYYVVSGPWDFFHRMLWGVMLTYLASNLLAYPNIYIIHLLNEKLPWNTHVLSRSFLEIGYGICWAFITGLSITLTANAFNPYEEPLIEVLVNNALIFAAANMLLLGILEAWLFFNESIKRKKEAERLEADMMKVQFNLLKRQLNPHFMFNSLNVLTGLIEADPKKAQEFTTEFSYIYRYVLSAIDEMIISLEKELDFVKSYIFLQQIRYGPNLKFKVDIDSRLLNHYLPPLALQSIIENAIKHNLLEKDNPLIIKITNEENYLIIKNNLQPKNEPTKQSGFGQKNLVRQYKMVHDESPIFKIIDNEYVVYLPLIIEEDEGIDH